MSVLKESSLPTAKEPRHSVEGVRLLIVNHTFSPTDGQGKVNVQVARRLLERGASVTLVGRETPDDLAAHPRVDVVRLGPMAVAPSRLLKHLTFGWRTRGVIRKLQPEHDAALVNGGMTFAPSDINLCHFVHASWLKSPEHPLRSPSRTSGLWSWYQYLYTKQACLWERDAYQRARKVVAVSDLVKQQLIHDVGIETEKIRVIENGIDESNLTDHPADRETARSKMGVADERLVIFFVGDLKTPRKNFDVLLRALPLLPDEVVLVAAGEQRGGPYPRLIQEAGLADRVRLLGMQPDVRSLYPGADLFALLSHYDPFALVVTEAMAAGLPVVTASTVGASSIVERFDAGVVIQDPNNADELAKVIRELLTNDSTREQKASHGRDAAAELAWDRVGDRYADLIAETVAAKRSEVTSE